MTIFLQWELNLYQFTSEKSNYFIICALIEKQEFFYIKNKISLEIRKYKEKTLRE
jgi:hypothetical protein